MTYEEVNATMPGTLFRVKGSIYSYMFLKGVSHFDHMVRMEMKGVYINLDPSQIKPLTKYDKDIIKRMYEAVFTDEDTRFNKVVEFIEKLK